MKPKWIRLAPIGLYVSLVAAIASFVLYVLQRRLTIPLEITLGFIIIGLAAYVLMAPDNALRALTGRQARYGSNALVLTLAFIGILVVVNFLGNTYSKRWDLTADKSRTLSKETVDILQKLSQPVKALGFFTSATSSDTARQLMDDYKVSSNGKFDYQIIDPNADPVAAQNLKISRDGQIVLTLGNQQEPVNSTDEQDMTSALIRLLNPGTRTVFFLTGHGEHDPNGTDQSAYSQVKTALVAKNYTVKTLNLLVDRKIPEDALAVIIAGPQKPISQDEVTLLNDYLTKGGSLVVLEDPTILSDPPVDDPLAKYLSEQWSITLGNDLVIDLTANPQYVAIAAQYSSHAITNKLGGMVTAFPKARSVKVPQPPPSNLTVLISTSQQSWAETDAAKLKNNQITFDNGTDLPGPVPLAVAAESDTSKARLVIVGNSEFASDANFSFYANGDFIINSIDWAAKQDSLINLTPKTNTQRVLATPQIATMGLIFLGSIVFLPFVIIASGIVVWVQRRRRG